MSEEHNELLQADGWKLLPVKYCLEINLILFR